MDSFPSIFGRRSTMTRIRKLEYLYFCLSYYAHTDLFSSHLFSFSPASSPPVLISYPRSLFAQHSHVGNEISFLAPLPLLSPRQVSIVLARTERVLRLAKVYDLYFLSFPFFLISRAYVLSSFSHPFCHSPSLCYSSLPLIYSFFFVLLSELRNPTKCGNC